MHVKPSLMLKPFFLLLGLVASLSASAQQPLQEKWSKHFEGDHRLIFQDYKEKQWGGGWDLAGGALVFKQWIKGYSQCQVQVDRVISAIERYDLAFRVSDTAESNEAYAELQLGLNPAEESCRAPAQRAYWVALINMGPENHPRFKSNYNHKNDMVLLMTLVANLDVIHPLTPELRTAWAAGDKKSLWTQKKDNEFILSGIYDCEEGRIYLSSNLKPFNAAASLAHEFDHFYRDKLGYEGLVEWREKKNIRQFIVSDEMIAALWGAFYQRNIYLMDKELHPGSKAQDDYTRQGDEFNLFKLDGPLSKLMDAVPMSVPFAFYEFKGILHSWRDRPEIAKKLCDTEDVIRKGYFGKKDRDCDVNNTFFPKAAWYQTENYLTHIRQLRQEPTKWAELFKDFDAIAETLKTRSPVCAAGHDAQSSGLLDDYIGKGLRKGKGPDHPGNGGVKPGRLLRPCLKVKY